MQVPPNAIFMAATRGTKVKRLNEKQHDTKQVPGGAACKPNKYSTGVLHFKTSEEPFT